MVIGTADHVSIQAQMRQMDSLGKPQLDREEGPRLSGGSDPGSRERHSSEGLEQNSFAIDDVKLMLGRIMKSQDQLVSMHDTMSSRITGGCPRSIRSLLDTKSLCSCRMRASCLPDGSRN